MRWGSKQADEKAARAQHPRSSTLISWIRWRAGCRSLRCRGRLVACIMRLASPHLSSCPQPFASFLTSHLTSLLTSVHFAA
ncbi:hypothetical protein BKA80DRAFT_284290 [Phyllosticta citrichinensis]